MDILSAVRLPRPRTFIPPAWFLSRKAIEALYDSDFDIAEARSALEFIKKRKKCLASQVMNWNRQGDKEKNKKLLKKIKRNFIDIYSILRGNPMDYLEWLFIHHMILMKH